MIQEIIKAFMLIFIAEMGDKTQILAMAFATRFPVRKVLLGIGIGAFLNHGLAVLLGSYLSGFVPINVIQMIAGAAFVGFALWTLKTDKEEEEEELKLRFGPVATVSLAFFLGELGDKTQLTAITLAADASYPFMILLGTVMGMIVTGALGIVIGKILGDRIPELGIKLLAASIFLFFGLQKLAQTLPQQYLRPTFVIPFLGVLSLLVAYMIRKLLHARKKGISSEFLAKSKLLYDYYQHMQKDLEHICMGSDYCRGCKGEQCVIGNAKDIIQRSLSNPDWQEVRGEREIISPEKPFVQEEVIDSLVDTLCLIESCSEEESLHNVHRIRNQLETILLGGVIEEMESVPAYIDTVRRANPLLANRIEGHYQRR